MRSPLRIAILECDELGGELKSEFGSISDVYKSFLEASASNLKKSAGYEELHIEFSSYDVVHKQDYPDIKDIDAVFVTGSSYDSFASGSNDWILKLIGFCQGLLQDQSRVRIVAVCFGHQIVARAYGIMPERSESGWEVSVTPIALTERGKQIFEKHSLVLHQMHRDIVPQYPPSVEKLGQSDRCHVQGIYVKNRVITVQGHPEFNAKIATEFLERRRGSLLDDTTYQDGMRRVAEPHDGVVVGAGFLRFLLEE